MPQNDWEKLAVRDVLVFPATTNSGCFEFSAWGMMLGLFKEYGLGFGLETHLYIEK
jgi:hypothetical protein